MRARARTGSGVSEPRPPLRRRQSSAVPPCVAACAVDERGAVVGEASFANDPAGHTEFARWAAAWCRERWSGSRTRRRMARRWCEAWGRPGGCASAPAPHPIVLAPEVNRVTAVPAGPAYIGTFELAATTIAVSLGYGPSAGLALALLVHAISLSITTLGGPVSRWIVVPQGRRSVLDEVAGDAPKAPGTASHQWVSSAGSSTSRGCDRSRADRIGSFTGQLMASSGSFHATPRSSAGS